MSEYRIVIAERGWIFVGLVSRVGEEVVINDCENIQRWGTTKGLGELALNGPTSMSVLHPYGVVRIHVLAVVGQVECDDSVWSKRSKKRAK